MPILVPFISYYFSLFLPRAGGRHDPAMLSTVGALGVPIVMMHMRGTPQTMASAEHCTYKSGDCIAEIASGAPMT
jgi:dihydropteroate synthase